MQFLVSSLLYFFPSTFRKASRVLERLVFWLFACQRLHLFAFMQNNYNIPKHRTQEERCAAARFLLSHNPPCTVRVDSMLDAANLAYGASPERLYIIRESQIVYQGGPGPMSYNTQEVRVWLEKFAGERIA